MPRQSKKLGAPELTLDSGHYGTDFVGIKGVSGARYCENAHALSMDGRLSGTLPGRGR